MEYFMDSDIPLVDTVDSSTGFYNMRILTLTGIQLEPVPVIYGLQVI